MDPEKCIADAIELLHNGEHEEYIEAIQAYFDWRKSRGFEGRGRLIAVPTADVYRAAFQCFGTDYVLKALCDDPDCVEDAYRGEYDSLEDYAAELVDDGVLGPIPEALKYYIDCEAFGRDLELGGDIVSHRVDGMLHVFSGRLDS
jgi:hypothetical protein